MSDDERSLRREKPAQLARIGASSRLITRGLARLQRSKRRFVRLPTPPDSSSSALAINNSGQVVGFVEDAAFDRRATVWERGRITVLQSPSGWQAIANDIDDHGRVVGNEFRQVPDPKARDIQECRPILWNNGLRIELQRLSSGSSQAVAINNRGEIVGTADKPLELRSPDDRFGTPLGWFGGTFLPIEFLAVLWSEGRLSELEPLFAGHPWDSVGAINDLGMVVGKSREDAVYWVGGRVHRLDLDFSFNAGANDCNNRGQVVGYRSNYGEPYENPFLWEEGNAVDLWEEGVAEAINARGEIVGYGYTATGLARACTWEVGQTTDLDSPIDGECRATDINDAGHVVGAYRSAEEGSWRACLWA